MILGYHYGTVEDIEIIWCLFAFIGLIVSLLNAFDSRGDLRYLKRKGIFNGRRLIAKMNTYTEFIRAAIQSIFLAIGIMAMLLPSPPNGPLPTKYLIFSILIRWGLIVASGLLTVKTIMLRRLRKSIIEGEYERTTRV